MITFDEKKYSQITEKEIKDALQFSTEQVIRGLPEFTEQFQKAYSENGFYQPIPNNYWTCGFWTGEIWLAYEYSQDERLKKAGQKASMVSMEIKYYDFRKISHQKQLMRPTSDQNVLYESACELFEEVWTGEPVRLLGIRTAKLVDEKEPMQLSIFDIEIPKPLDEKHQKLKDAMEKLDARFGLSLRQV